MAYIGKTPTVGNFQVCDAISVVNGQAAYTLQVGGVNVAPESANHMLVSLNGILQKPGSSFTISGSTMTFASNLATGDVIDFVQILGNVLDLGQPSDDTVKTASIQANAVTAAKFNADVISGQTALTSEPADTDEFLVSDAGVLKRIDYSLIKASGIEEVDMWRITANKTSDGVSEVTANWERADTGLFSYVGTGVSESSGIFSFPSTGYWLIQSTGYLYANGGARQYAGVGLKITDDNSSYSTILNYYGSMGGNGYYSSPAFSYILRCSNTTNQKIKMFIESASGQDIRADGDTDTQRLGLIFIKLRGL